MRASTWTLSITALFAGWIAAAPVAVAHPHVWVTMKETVLYDKGAITGLQQAWTFDEIYTQTAIEGLDKNGDGKYDREELKELAQVNIDGLKEFAYFTVAKPFGDKALTFKPPVDYWLDYTDKGILTLFFTLPLEAPVPADAKGFTFAVFNSSYFIAFEFAEADRRGELNERLKRRAGFRRRPRQPPEIQHGKPIDACDMALGQDGELRPGRGRWAMAAR